jgi:hypothetical protein
MKHLHNYYQWEIDLKSLKKLQGPSCNIMEIDTSKELRNFKTQTSNIEKTWSIKATKKEQEAMEEKVVYPTQFYKSKKRGYSSRPYPCLKDIQRKKIAGLTVEVKMTKDLGEYKAKTKDLLLEFMDVCLHIQGHERNTSIYV